MFSYTRATKSFSTTLTDRARVAASDPTISSLSRERCGSNNAISFCLNSDAPGPANRLKTFNLCACPPSVQSSDYTSGVSAKSIEDCQSRLDVPRLRRHLHALHGAAQFCRDLTSNGYALVRGPLEAVRAPHALEQRIRNADAWHFVGHELGVSRALERKNAGDDREPRTFDPLHERFEAPHIEDRARDDELGATVDLLVQAAQLLIEVRRRRIDRDADMKRCRRADRLPADVAPAIEPRHEVGQPDRVDVEDSGRIRIIADPPGIASDEHQVSQPHRVRAKQVGLDAQQIAIA